MINEQLQEQVSGLKASEEIKLAERIAESSDKPDLQIRKKWIEESEKRYDAYKAGKVKAISCEDVIKRLYCRR